MTTRRTPTPPRPAAPGGFTLVELLVVIGIIALLISILLPTLNQARESAKVTVCLGQNLRSTGQSSIIFANEHDGYLPRNQAWSRPTGPFWRTYMYLPDYLTLTDTYSMVGEQFVCPSYLSASSGSNRNANRHDGPILLGPAPDGVWYNGSDPSKSGFGEGGENMLRDAREFVEVNRYPTDPKDFPVRTNWWTTPTGKGGGVCIADFGSYMWLGGVPTTGQTNIANRQNWEVLKLGDKTHRYDESINGNPPLMADRMHYDIATNGRRFNHGDKWEIAAYDPTFSEPRYFGTGDKQLGRVEQFRGDAEVCVLYRDGSAQKKVPDPVPFDKLGNALFFY